MTVALLLIGFVPGLAIGSFLNVVIARLPERRSIVRPRSACPHCQHEIAWYDNVPLISYAVLRGRCRNCAQPISWRYPAVELVTGALVAACFAVFGLSLEALVASFFCVVLVAISAIDTERRIIPNRIVIPATAIVLAAQTAIHPSPEWAIAGVSASLALFVLLLAYPAGLGMGDVKLVMLLGAMLGRTVIVSLFVGCLAAMVPAIVLFARHGKAARKMAIPFGPFLALGAIVALFAGHQLFDAWLRLGH